MSSAIAQYRELRDETQHRIEQLLARHSSHITCVPGCTDCCLNRLVLPVEYYSILDELQQTGCTELVFDSSANCGFLKNGLCSLYAARPLICRVQGLPVAHINEGLSPPVASISICPKNFGGADFDEVAFGPENTLDQEALEVELARVNRAFMEERGESGRPATRIPLYRLVGDLADLEDGECSQVT